MSKKTTIGEKIVYNVRCSYLSSVQFPSRRIFNDRVTMINRHNHDANLGLHSYTLKINQFADMVNIRYFHSYEK